LKPREQLRAPSCDRRCRLTRPGGEGLADRFAHPGPFHGRNRGPQWPVYKVAKEVGSLRQSTTGRLSVLNEVLRAQARHRRMRRAGLAAAMLLVVLVSLWPGPGRPSATGAVTGFIQPCAALPFPQFTSTGARLFSAAATAEALRGHGHWKPVGDGTYQAVFPAVVARQRVSQNQKFLFGRLSPGQYVILARYAEGNAITWLDVSVIAGRTSNVDLPDMCF